jgi:hypothetical protein
MTKIADLTYQPLGPRASAISISVVLGSGAAALVAFAVRPPIGALLAVLVCILSIYSIVQAWRMHVRVDESGIHGVNHWRQRHFAWTEIRELRPKLILIGGPIPAVAVGVVPNQGRVFRLQMSISPRNRAQLLQVLRTEGARRGIHVDLPDSAFRFNDSPLMNAIRKTS